MTKVNIENHKKLIFEDRYSLLAVNALNSYPDSHSVAGYCCSGHLRRIPGSSDAQKYSTSRFQELLMHFLGKRQLN